MNLTDRYIYAVTKRLPASQREDIRKELKSLIEDMIEERGGYSEQAEEEVLTKLGDPKILANNYSGTGKYLIGPELYGTYTMILKIALPIIMALAMLGTSVDAVSSGKNVVVILLTIIGSAFSAALSVIGTVTIIFAGLEKHAKTDLLKEMHDEKEKAWNPKDLPEVEKEVKPLGIAGIITGIIGILVFLFFINSSWLANSPKIVWLVNRETFSVYLIYINILLGLQLLFLASKLVFRKWTYAMAAINTVLNIAGLLLFLVIISDPNLVNLNQLLMVKPDAKDAITLALHYAKRSLQVIVPAAVLYDSGEGFYYAYKNR